MEDKKSPEIAPYGAEIGVFGVKTERGGFEPPVHVLRVRRFSKPSETFIKQRLTKTSAQNVTTFEKGSFSDRMRAFFYHLLPPYAACPHRPTFASCGPFSWPEVYGPGYPFCGRVRNVQKKSACGQKEEASQCDLQGYNHRRQKEHELIFSFANQ